jgi:hypothetical protein
LSPRSLLGPRSADPGTGVTDSEVSEVPKRVQHPGSRRG